MTAFFQGYLAQGIGSGSGFVENSAAGYVRQPVTFTPMVAGNTSLAASVMSGPVLVAAVTQRALFDAATGGNLIMWWNLTSAFPLTAGATDSIRVGSLSHTFPALRTAGQGGNPVDMPAGSMIGTTSNGDTIYAGVAVEVENGVIYAGSGGVPGTGGSGGPGASTPRVITSGTSATLNTADYVVGVNQATPAPITVTMPASPTAGYPYVISDVAGAAAANNITLAGNTGQTIKGNAVIATNGGAKTLYWIPNLNAYVVAA